MAKNNTESIDVAVKQITVRILADIEINGKKLKAGHAEKMDSNTAAALVAQGTADDNAEAVAYALTEKH